MSLDVISFVIGWRASGKHPESQYCETRIADEDQRR
jgi:hypothetical protein